MNPLDMFVPLAAPEVITADRTPEEVAFLVGFLVGSNQHAWMESDALGRQVLVDQAEAEFETWLESGRPLPVGVEL